MTMLDDTADTDLAPTSWTPESGSDPLIRHKHGKVGRPISRVDGALKVTGAAPFAAEYDYDGLAYAALAFSTVPRGAIATLDTARAEAAPGVVLVMTHENAPEMAPMPRFMSGPKAGGGDDLPIMQDPTIHWNGQAIALVLADTQEQADHAAGLIEATYDRHEDAVTDLAEARRRGTEQGKFQGEPLKQEDGDARAALKQAAVSIDASYTTPSHNHNALELHAVTLRWEGDELEVHDASQGVAHSAWTLAQIFGLDESQVHVTSPYVGGGFGSKTVWHHQALAAAAARLSGRPVRITLSREGVYRLVGGRARTEQRVALGAGEDGKLTALIHEGVSAKGRNAAIPEPFILPTMASYTSETMALDLKTATLDMISNTFMRAPGESVGSFALECAMDELAHALDMDPVELRIANEPQADPLSGTAFSQRDLVKAWRDGAARFRWSARGAPGSRVEGEWQIGLGCAMATYPYHRMPGGAARITLSREGAAKVEIAAHEMGMGTATAHVQVVADRLGLETDAVTFDYGDSVLPGIVLAGGSQQTASIGFSIAAAHRALTEELLKLAGNDSPLAGLSADEVAGDAGGLASLADPTRREDYGSILDRAQRGEVSAMGEATAPEETQKWSMHSTGAVFCEARVNSVTGETRIPRILGSYDCGRILNPKTAASQFRGGIIMGLGLALMEETQMDTRSGRIMNPSLAEYHVPVHADVPAIEVMWTGIPDPHAPMGARGIGEIGITGVAAAVANAVFNATGTRVRNLPLTPDRLM